VGRVSTRRPARFTVSQPSKQPARKGRKRCEPERGNEREKPVVPASAPSEDGPDNCTDNGTDGKGNKKSNKGSQRVSQHVSPPNQLMPAIRRTSTIRRSRDEVTQRGNVGTCCRAEDSSPSKAGKYSSKRAIGSNKNTRRWRKGSRLTWLAWECRKSSFKK
jgi:hypothetical protein